MPFSPVREGLFVSAFDVVPSFPLFPARAGISNVKWLERFASLLASNKVFCFTVITHASSWSSACFAVRVLRARSSSRNFVRTERDGCVDVRQAATGCELVHTFD